MTRVVVTGGSGKAGRAVVHDLLEHGYHVLNVDRVPDPNLPDDRQVVADVTDYAATAAVLEGADAVVHLAARAASGYALSKVVGEETAKQFARVHGIAYVALRFSNVMEPADYERFPTYWDDPQVRRWNLWGYVDARDAAQACRLGLEADVAGADNLIIAAADTVMTRPSGELLAEEFPGVALRHEIGEHETLLAIDRARERLGFAPAHSWRDHVPS